MPPLGGNDPELRRQTMNTQRRTTLLAAIMAGTALLTVGCSDNRNETTGQAVDRTANKMAAATDRATDKVAAATDRATDKVANATDKAIVAVDDTAITTKVKGAVMAQPGLKTLQIDVDTKNGVVTLTGTVDNPTLKERATQIAQNVDGVRSVVDHLVVKAT
jgi:hyperosmotically inducible protein